MPRLNELNQRQREKLLEDVLTLFLLFCKQEFDVTLYDYQIKIARACLSSLFVDSKDVFIKISRQSGKTETLTLLLKFMIIYYVAFTKRPLMAAIASPHGEQAKTDIDRIKKSIGQLRDRWSLEDKENNAATIRAYRLGKLTCEMYRFSLAPTTHNESKSLNLLVIEEAHQIDDVKRSDELDPMLASTGGPTWYVGVGCTRLCDYKRGCDGEYSEAHVVRVDVEEVIRDRRKVYELTKDPIHLEYEKKFLGEVAKKGKDNPEIRRNYYMEDTVEQGNFVSRERFLSCGRTDWQYKNGILIPVEDLTLSLDWARRSDFTWPGLTTRSFDLMAMWKLPHVRYEEQIQMLMDELKTPRKCKKRLPDGTEVDEEFRFFDRITTVRGDSTGVGDFPMEFLRDHSGLPMGEDSSVQFTKQSKNEMYSVLDAAIYRSEADPLRFSYFQGDPLAAELEDQFTSLLREYTGGGEFLSPHAPEEPGYFDDACSMAALGCLGAAQGITGEIQIF